MKIAGVKKTIIDFLVDDSNACVFFVKDISEYHNFGKNCINFYILPPGFHGSQVVVAENLVQGFELMVDKCMLGIQQTGCGEYREELQDGNYYFELNVNGEKHHKNIYRINRLMSVYYELLCCVEKKYGNSYFIKDIYRELTELRVYMDSIKALAEKCECPDKADILYSDVQKQIKQMHCRYCGC